MVAPGESKSAVRWRRIGLAGIAIAVFSWVGPAAAQRAFVPLGDLPGGVFDSRASAVSADGSVVVGRGIPSWGYENAFRWTSETGMVGLGYLSGTSTVRSYATAISADGSTIVGVETLSGLSDEAFRWTADGGMTGLGDLPGGSFLSTATGVSSDGAVVVGYGSTASGYQAFRWTADSGMVELGYLPSMSARSVAYGVSADGSVIVGESNSASSGEAFRWTAESGMVGLGVLEAGYGSSASAVSADGSVVVGVTGVALGNQAFQWTADGRMTGLGYLHEGHNTSGALAVSANGSVIVGWSDDGSTPENPEAFVWDATHGMRSLHQLLSDLGLNVSGWELNYATGISADGRTIVGVGLNPSREQEAWLAVLVPEPSAGLVMGIGLAGFFARRRHGIA